MDIRKLQRTIVDGLEDVKGQDILVLNTEHLSALFERVIIASGTSTRQTKALASSVREAVKAAGMPVLATEGADNGEWIIVDCGAAVAHIMQPAIRDYYRLEEIWGGKPVKMTLRAAAKGLVKASEFDADDEDDEPVKKRPARKTTAAAKTAARSAGKSALAKPKVVPLTPAKKAANRAVAAKKALAMAAPAKPARPVVQTGRAGQLAAARKTAAKSPVAKSPAAKVASAKTLVVKPIDRRTPAVKAVAAKKAARRPAAKTAAAKTAAVKTTPRKPRA